MFISVGEVIVVGIIGLIVLEPHDIVKIMRKIGQMIYFLKEKYTKLAKEIESWWHDRK